MVGYLAPTAALAALLAICFWIAPNNIVPALREQKPLRLAVWIGVFISAFGLIVAAPRFLGL